jgi:putative ABC transport system substrate-binding protein
MANEPDPVGTGIVTSLSHPGGNVTGLSDLHADLAPKRLQLLKEAVPSASRVAVLLNPATPHAVIQWKSIQAAAPTVGVTLLPVEVKGPDDIDRAFTAIRKQRPGGLLIIPDVSWTAGRQGRIADLALKSGLPARPAMGRRGFPDVLRDEFSRLVAARRHIR